MQLEYTKVVNFCDGLFAAELDNLINHLLVGFLYQMPGIFRAFGFHKDTPALIGVVLVAGLLITPYNVVSFSDISEIY